MTSRSLNVEVRAPAPGVPLRPEAMTVRHALDTDLGMHGLTLRRLAWAAAIILVFTVSSTLANAIATDGSWPRLGTIAHYFPLFVVQNTLWIVPALFAGILADRAPVSGLRRAAVVFVALLIAGQVSIPLQELVVFPCEVNCRPVWSVERLKQLAEFGFDVTIHSCAIAMAYYAQRRDVEVAAALRASEMARADAERERLAAALQTMQARIDPVFLLDALREVGTRYNTDPDSAGRLLDLLNAYLRAALPRTAEIASTVRREFTLLRTWLDIAALRSDARLVVECRLDEALHSASMPPLTLVPLAGAVAQAGAASGSVRLRATGTDDRVRVTLQAQGDVAATLAPATAVADTRERLRAFYGDRATLAVERRDARALQLILEAPT